MSNSGNDWFEVWSEDQSPRPPYLLIVRPNPSSPLRFQVLDPIQANSVVFESEDYEAVRTYLLEDEFGLVRGRTTL
jgi:hypothetical protein